MSCGRLDPHDDTPLPNVRCLRGWSSAIAVACAVFVGAGCGGKPAAPKKPNVLLLCIDALRADRLGSYGGTGAASPYLDRLAAGGVVFDNAYSVASWTKPSVPSLLTGLYPSHHGVFDSSRHGVDVLDDGVVTLAQRLAAADYRTGAFVENSHLDRRYSHLDRGFETYVENAGDAPYITHHFFSWLERRQAAGRPFFAYLHFLDVHWPYTPRREWLERELKPAERATVIEWNVTGKRWWLLRNAVRDGLLDLQAEDVELLERLYDAEIRDTDAEIGRMLELLAAREILDDTIVIVTADHGEGFLDHGRLDHGYGLYEELLRIPLIVWMPGRRDRGARIDVPVQIVDVAPTILEAVGLDASSSDGRSLLGPIAGRPEENDRVLLFEEHHGSMVQNGIRAGRYKFIRTVRPGAEPTGDAGEFSIPADLLPGVRVQAEGIFAVGRLVADEVKLIDAGDDDCELAGPLERFDTGAGGIAVLGRWVAVSGPGARTLKLIDGHDHFRLEDLHTGEWVRVHVDMVDGKRVASKIERLRDEEDQEIEIEGLIGNVEVRDGRVLLQLCDDRIVLSPEIRWKGVSEGRRTLSVTPKREELVSETLYDLIEDPHEQHDLAPEHPPVLEDLRQELARMLERFGGESKKGDAVPLDPATRERLRALGYLR